MTTYEGFTDRARRVLSFAQQEAQRGCHGRVDAHHILIGLMKEGWGVAANVLKECGLTLAMIVGQVEKTHPKGIYEGNVVLFTSTAEWVINQARLETGSIESPSAFAGTEHLLLALIRSDSNTAVDVLRELNVPLSKIREKIYHALSTHEPLRVERLDANTTLLKPPTHSFQEGETPQIILLKAVEEQLSTNEEYEATYVQIGWRKKENPPT